MQPKAPNNKMTPYPLLQKMNRPEQSSAELYTKNNLSALRKLTLPTSRNGHAFLFSKGPKSNTDRKAPTNKLYPFKKSSSKRGPSSQNKHLKKNMRHGNVTRNELFRERNSVPAKESGCKMGSKKSFGAKPGLSQKTSMSLYNSGRNHNFNKMQTRTSGSIGGRDGPSQNASPKLDDLKSEMSKLKSEFDRKATRKNALFLKEFNKFNRPAMQLQYSKPKLKLVQKQGHTQIGIKAFPKMSFSRKGNSRERFSIGFSSQLEKFSQMTTTSNTLNQLEKVRVFDVRSKWFKPKKNLNFSDKSEVSKGRMSNVENKVNSRSKARSIKVNGKGKGLVMNLKKKIQKNKNNKSSDQLFLNNLTSKQSSVDLYSNLKQGHHKTENVKNVDIENGLEGNFYRRIYRYFILNWNFF
jgi:hypothetical protein